MIDFLLLLLTVSGSFFTLLGLFTVFHWFKTPSMPSDDSNRLNNITSWWIGLTRPSVMAYGYKFFRQDALKNINDVEK